MSYTSKSDHYQPHTSKLEGHSEDMLCSACTNMQPVTHIIIKIKKLEAAQLCYLQESLALVSGMMHLPQ